MRYLIGIFLLFVLKTAAGQEKHFIYIQSDNKQPFYVSLNGKIFSSTASGYVIIPKLLDGTYEFKVGFAGNATPEQSFKCVIDNKDLGYNLKNFQDQGWGLFNLQTLAVTMAADNSNAVVQTPVQPAKEEYKPEITFEPKKVLPPPPAEAKVEEKVSVAPPAATTTMPEKAVAKPQEEKPASSPASEKATADESVRQGDIRKVNEVQKTNGTYLTYVDGKKGADTIHIIIPSSGETASSETSTQNTTAKKETKSVAIDSAITSSNSSNAPVTATNNADKTGDLHFLNISVNGSKDSSATNTAVPVSTPTSINVTCKNVASDEDVVRLRRRMAIENTDDKMIDDAKKAFRNKCFSTAQIKTLSTLFMSDEGRYHFFDASYDHVADATVYASLQSEFIDPYYINRFKAMLRK